MVTEKLLTTEKLSGLVLIVRRAMLKRHFPPNTPSTVQLTLAIGAAGERDRMQLLIAIETADEGSMGMKQFLIALKLQTRGAWV